MGFLSSAARLINNFTFFALLIFVPSVCSQVSENSIKRSDFPSNFLFGVSTSAIQIEGSLKGEGRGPSVWDYFAHRYSDKIADHSNPDISIDSYSRFTDDIIHLKRTGAKAHRFSLSWPRIIPTTDKSISDSTRSSLHAGSVSDGINPAGVEHYNKLINLLLANGITPFVTLFHFDSPQDLETKYGGFLNKSIVKDFKEYSGICFEIFGDRVKHWITINEPFIIANFGYEMGRGAPGRCSPPGCQAGNSSTEPYIASHNLLLAHAAAARLYKQQFQARQGGEIGITLVGQYFEPYSKSVVDMRAAKRAIDFNLGWYLEPLVTGSYPLTMVKLVKERLPEFTEEEKQMVKGSFDFIGINYYTTRFAKGLPVNRSSLTTTPPSFTTDLLVDSKVENANGALIGNKAEGSPYIYIYPIGLGKLLQYIKKKYRSPKIYVTENGVTEARNDSRPVDQALNDQHRVKFIREHLYQLHRAMKNGVNVAGYFYWTLFDCFEFNDGYNVRFGLYFVDYNNNFTRVPKQSVKWLRNFLRN